MGIEEGEDQRSNLSIISLRQHGSHGQRMNTPVYSPRRRETYLVRVILYVSSRDCDHRIIQINLT